MNSLTCYAAAKIINANFKSLGIEKTIPTQMMYNYTTARIRQGKNSFIGVDSNGSITTNSLDEWFAKYLKKNFNRDWNVVVDDQSSFDMSEAN